MSDEWIDKPPTFQARGRVGIWRERIAILSTGKTLLLPCSSISQRMAQTSGAYRAFNAANFRGVFSLHTSFDAATKRLYIWLTPTEGNRHRETESTGSNNVSPVGGKNE